MKLPEIANPAPYVGLYVVELNGQTAVGYTAAEVAMLLESEANRVARIFRIHRARPNGEMELAAVHPDRFQLESGMFFYRPREDEARKDFDELKARSEQRPAPCRATIQLARTPGAPQGAFCAALIYPAEYDPEISAWLEAVNYAGGDAAEGGVSAVTSYRQAAAAVLDRHQIPSPPMTGELATRSREELQAALGQTLQRKLA